MNKSCIFRFSNVKEKVKVAFTFDKSLKPQIKGMPQTTNCDNSKRSAYIIAIDNGSNEWNCVFFLKKKMKNMAFYGYVDRKCYIMIFSWIIPKDGFICFVSSQLLMIVEKKPTIIEREKKVLCFCDNFMNVVIRRPLFTIIWLITCHSMKSRKFLVVKIKLMLDWNLSAISVQKFYLTEQQCIWLFHEFLVGFT